MSEKCPICLNIIGEKEGEVEGGEDEAVRAAGKTRPLALSNTDNKLLATAFAQPLTEHAPSYIHAAQTGGVRGRQMLSNVLPECSLSASKQPSHL